MTRQFVAISCEEVMNTSQNDQEDDSMDEYDDTEADSEPAADHGSCEAIEGIEDMVISFLSQLSSFGHPSRAHSNSDEASDTDGSEDLQFTSQRSLQNKKAKIELRLVDRTKVVGSSGSPVHKSVIFPKKCAKGSVRPMAQLLRVLDLTHEALVDDIPVTKRDIYYKDVALFKSQRVVDSLVDDLAATFELERSDLNIRASSKGLICGSGLAINLRTGENIELNDTEGSLIPVGEDIQTFGVNPEVSWVLVVEKEAVFQTLCRLKLANHTSLPGRGLIITGKGYPDVATRHLVKTLADALPSRIPILVMVDGDPYGIDILSVYKYGSRSMQHENSKLAASRIEWLGLWSSELETFGIDRNRLLPITVHDEKKALSMLRRPVSAIPLGWRKELMHMLHTRRKAEIEILSTMKPDPQAYNIPHPAERTSGSLCSDDDDTTMSCHIDDDHPYSTTSFSTSSASGLSISSPTATAFCRSSPLTSPPSSPANRFTWSTFPSVPPRAPLVQYLVCKITESVVSAQSRAKAVHVDA